MFPSRKRLYLEFTILIILVAVLVVQRGMARKQAAQAVQVQPEISETKADVTDFERLLSLHKVKAAPGPYDWMAQHYEPGQTFSEYIKSSPVRPDEKRNVIYIVLLGGFDPAQKQIVKKTAEFIRVFYGQETRFLPAIPISSIPKTARRVHPQTGDKQILSTYVIEHVLHNRLPEDGYSLIAFTSSDLWPGDGWNFVFGQASLDDRLGVWSIYRNGDPKESQESYDLCLRRTAATGLHELGHMFGMHHCIYFECLMNGSNHRKESDERPLWLCPVCLRKILWLNGQDVKKRFHVLADMAESNNMLGESMLYRESGRMLR